MDVGVSQICLPLHSLCNTKHIGASKGLVPVIQESVPSNAVSKTASSAFRIGSTRNSGRCRLRSPQAVLLPRRSHRYLRMCLPNPQVPAVPFRLLVVPVHGAESSCASVFVAPACVQKSLISISEICSKLVLVVLRMSRYLSGIGDSSFVGTYRAVRGRL